MYTDISYNICLYIIIYIYMCVSSEKGRASAHLAGLPHQLQKLGADEPRHHGRRGGDGRDDLSGRHLHLKGFSTTHKRLYYIISYYVILYCMIL